MRITFKKIAFSRRECALSSVTKTKIKEVEIVKEVRRSEACDVLHVKIFFIDFENFLFVTNNALSNANSRKVSKLDVSKNTLILIIFLSRKSFHLFSSSAQ